MIAVIVPLIFVLLVGAEFIFLSYRFEKLLRQIRKLAALYPPYPLAEDNEGKVRDTSHVQIEKAWDEDRPATD